MILILFVAIYMNSHAIEFNDSSIIRLSDVDIHASRQKQFSEIGKVLKVVHADEIRSLPVQTLDVLLKNIAGVDVRQRGMGGTQADISLRGGSFDQVLILLNGVNITDPQTGHHNLNIPIDLSEVARVEVLQGSAARRYGNQAFSGAINIVTDTHSKSLIDASLSAGSFNTYAQKLTVGLGKKALRHFTSVAHNSSDGYRPNTDYKTLNVYSQTTWNSNKLGDFDFQAAWQHKSFGANGFYALAYPNQFEHTQTQFSSLSWQKAFSDLHVNIRAYQRRHYDRFELFRDFQGAASWYVDHNYHLTDVSGGVFDFQHFADFGKISGGVELRNDHIFSTVLGTEIQDINQRPKNQYERQQDKYFNKEAARFIKTGYVDFSKNIQKVYFSAGASISQSEEFGVQNHFGGDVSYFFTNHLSVFATANTASRLPTFTDLYYQSATQNANPNLKPEFSTTAELGMKYHHGAFQLQGSTFFRQGKNIIDWVKFPDQEKWESMNLTELNTFGVHVAGGYSFDKMILNSISFAYSFINADKLLGDFDSKYALDYLRHQIIFQANHKIINNLEMTWNISYNDRAGDYADFISGNKMNYQPYLMVSSRVAWQFRNFVIYADANNLLDNKFVDFGGLPQPGRHGNLGVRFNF